MVWERYRDRDFVRQNTLKFDRDAANQLKGIKMRYSCGAFPYKEVNLT